MDEYASRFRAMWNSCGPGSWQYLIVSDTAVEAARAAPDVAASRQLLAAVVHPDTGEVVPALFRMSAHVPVNALLLTLMLSARSPGAVAVTQALNQCFNAAQFFCNRNASNAVPDATLAVSFAGAVSSAVGVAAMAAAGAARAARSATQRGDVRGISRAAMLASAVPFLGAAAAKPLQIGAMRQDEFLGDGVAVSTVDGEYVGRSQAAGVRAVAATISTRILYLAPMLWMPAVQMALERVLLPRGASAAARGLLFVAHSAVTSAIVTPACIAIFAQRASVRASSLEPSFAALGDTVLFYNKGL